MRRRSAWAIFAVPALIAVLTGAGLLTGLLGDGPWDAASWVGLGVPVLVAARCYSGRVPAAVGRKLGSRRGAEDAEVVRSARP